MSRAPAADTADAATPKLPLADPISFWISSKRRFASTKAVAASSFKLSSRIFLNNSLTCLRPYSAPARDVEASPITSFRNALSALAVSRNEGGRRAVDEGRGVHGYTSALARARVPQVLVARRRVAPKFSPRRHLVGAEGRRPRRRASLLMVSSSSSRGVTRAEARAGAARAPSRRATPFCESCATCASRSCPRAPAGSRAVVRKRVRAYATVWLLSPPNYRTGRCKIPNPNWRCKQKLPLLVSRRSPESFGTRSGRILQLSVG